MAESILVISPHPDDAEVGAGGTIIKWAEEGKEIYLVLCTNGDKGSSDPEMTSDKLAKIRRQEQEEAAKVLGVKEMVFLDYPDGGLEDTPEFREKLVRLIRRFKPEAILANDPYKRYFSHRDHRIAGIVALDAAWPYARDHLFYPEHAALGLYPHKVKEVFLWRPDDPNFYVDISQTIEKKQQALQCHKSQFGQRHFRIGTRMRELAEAAGKERNMALAETFYRLEFPG